MRIASALALLAAAAAPAADRRRVPDAAPTGPAVSCLNLTGIRETRVRDDRTIDFVMRGGGVYRNTLPYACPALGFEQRFGYAVSTGRLCSVDIITVFRESPLSRGASCGLGAFQPVTLAGKEGATR